MIPFSLTGFLLAFLPLTSLHLTLWSGFFPGIDGYTFRSACLPRWLEAEWIFGGVKYQYGGNQEGKWCPFTGWHSFYSRSRGKSRGKLFPEHKRSLSCCRDSFQIDLGMPPRNNVKGQRTRQLPLYPALPLAKYCGSILTWVGCIKGLCLQRGGTVSGSVNV